MLTWQALICPLLIFKFKIYNIDSISVQSTHNIQCITSAFHHKTSTCINTLYELLIDSYIYKAVSVVSVGGAGQGEGGGCQSRGVEDMALESSAPPSPSSGSQRHKATCWGLLCGDGVLKVKRYCIFVLGNHALSSVSMVNGNSKADNVTPCSLQTMSNSYLAYFWHSLFDAHQNFGK